MNRQAFYDYLRKRDSGVFGTSLSQAQVEGLEALILSMQRNQVKSQHHASNISAQVYHETGGHMLPIKETVMPHHKDKNPSDATVIRRLDRAFASGRLPWVRTPYWRDGAFGRGPIQTTHWANYERMGKRLGLPLRQQPELLLVPSHGADSAVIGMMEGIYTGKKLSDYQFPEALYAKPSGNPRRIVNGKDGTDAKIAKYHMAFYNAFEAAGGWEPAPESITEIPDAETPPAKETPMGVIALLLHLIAKLFGRKD